MKTTKRRSRVLAIISSKHSTRDLPCKFPKQIYYFNFLKKQEKERIECASKYENKKWQKPQG